MEGLRRIDRDLIAGLAAMLLTVGAIRAFISTVYFRNLATLGINASVLYALLFLAAVALLAPVLARRERATLVAAAGALVAARVAMALAWGLPPYLMLSGLAVAAAMCALPLLARQARLARGFDGLRSFAVGAGLGFALDAALTFAGRSVDVTARWPGLVVVLPAGALLLAVVVERVAPPRAWSARADRKGGLLAGAGIGAFVFLEHAVLASPHALARWNELSVAPLAVGTILGLALPAILESRGTRFGPVGLTVMNVFALLAVLDHTFVHSSALPLLLVPAQAALVLDLVLLLHPAATGGVRDAGLAFLVAGGVALLLHFVFAFAFTWGFVPLSSLWRGAERWLVPGAFLLASLPALAIARRERGRERAFEPLHNPSAALLVLPVLVVMLGILVPAAAVHAPPAEAPMRVMTFNLHQGFNNDGVVDVEAFRKVLEEEDPDLVVLQESDTPRVTSANVDVVAYLAARLGYHEVYGQPTSGEGFGGALLSRYPVREWHVTKLPATNDSRFVLEARIAVGARDVWVYAAHLALPADDREREMAIVLGMAAARSGPKILAGDLNSCPYVRCPDYEGPDDSVYADVASAWTDTWTAKHGGAPNAPSAWTYEASNITHRIDYVWVSDEFETRDARTVRSEAALAASDHLPVVAEVRLR